MLTTRIFTHLQVVLLLTALLSPATPAHARRAHRRDEPPAPSLSQAVSEPPGCKVRYKCKDPRLQEVLDSLRLRRQSVITGSRFATPEQALRPHSESVTTTAVRAAARHVVVDAGHGGYDSGASSHGVKEKNINLAVALKLRDELTKRGLKVTMIRDNDTFVDLDERWQRSNAAKADCFVSVHTNDTDASTSPSGIETYYYTSQSYRLACCAYDALVSRLNANGRFVKCVGFRVVKNADIPATLVEMGYIGNYTDRNNLIDPDYQSRLAEALSEGIERFLQGASPRKPLIASKPKPVKRRTKHSTRKPKRSRKARR